MHLLHWFAFSFLLFGRFFVCLETLISCGLCGPTSPLAFGESVLETVSGSVEVVENKEHLWRMWSVVVNPLTDTITQVCSVFIEDYSLVFHFEH